MFWKEGESQFHPKQAEWLEADPLPEASPSSCPGSYVGWCTMLEILPRTHMLTIFMTCMDPVTLLVGGSLL